MNNSNGIGPEENNSFNDNLTSTSIGNMGVNANTSNGEVQNNFNQPINNPVVNENIDYLDVNPPLNNSQNYSNNVNQVNPINQNPTPVVNNIPPMQNYNPTNISDEELLRAFIGNNYDKITTKPFNFAGFFFTTFYMFYRKMFLYSILLFIVNLIVINIINNYLVTLLFSILVGLFINKVYLFYAKNKIAKIRQTNSSKTGEELKAICSKEGGVSTGKIFLGFLVELGITILVVITLSIIGIGSIMGDLLDLNNWNITINGNDLNNNSDNNINENNSSQETLLEDVSISGYSCINSNCYITITDASGKEDDYGINSNDAELFKIIDDYSDYVKININYIIKNSKREISSYKIYLKSNNTDISSVKNENELRDKIGLYSLGTHTDTFTLKEVGSPGFGYQDGKSYTYMPYTFISSENIEYKMKYLNTNNTLNLTEGNKYNVTFEVVEGTFDYDFNIISIN